MFDFLDTYRNLTIKTLVSLNWVYQTYNTKILIKCDDDILYNITDLHQTVFQHFGNQSKYSVNLVGGLRASHGPVRRKGKFALSKEVFPAEKYPVYCLGGIYAVSRPVIPLLLNQTKTTPTIHIEDAFLGILAQKAGDINFVSIPRWFVRWHNDTNLEEYRKYHSVHLGHLNVENMVKIWREIYHESYKMSRT